jgi:lysophospholipase L1-like esterase
MNSIRRFAVNTCLPAIIVALTTASPAARAQTDSKFVFGSKTETGWNQVSPTNLYSDATGYGFEPGADVVAPDGGNYVASDKPFYFSVKEPEGNYKVTAVFGDGTNESVLTVKAELRRLMLEKIPVAPGKKVSRSFIVNIRTPFISESNHVHLKSREEASEIWAWDDKMTLEFNGTHPCLRSLEIKKVTVPTVFVMGDSTVCDQPAAPWNSWGQMLPRFFKPEIAVANHAESGETVADSLHVQRFAKIFSLMKPGDYLFVQFGHNDMKNHAPNALGIYKSDLKSVVERTRALGGTPVLVTSMEREAGVNGPTLMGYPQAMRDAAKEEDCALIDLNAMSLPFYRALGDNLSKAFVSGQGTHHDNYGSYEFAKCVVEGVIQDKLPLAKYIVDDFKGFDPAHPDPVADFQMPVSPVHSDEKPLGN